MTVPSFGAPDASLDAQLDALRAAQPQRGGVLPWLRIEALARRAADQSGTLREQLDQRLQALLIEHRARLSGLVPQGASTPSASASAAGVRGLCMALAAAAEAADSDIAAPPATLDPATISPYELRALRRHRPTWAQLSAEQQLRRTMDQVPPQAGPLNSPHLLHRALRVMQAHSASYLQHFVAHVDALLWLERLQTPAAGTPVPAGRLPAAAVAAPGATSTSASASTASVTKPAGRRPSSKPRASRRAAPGLAASGVDTAAGKS